MKEIYYISEPKETYYGHNDRTKHDFYFANYDDEGIINIGEEETNGQGGVFISRPYSKDDLVESLKYLVSKHYEFLELLFKNTYKCHLEEFTLAFEISPDELKK